MGSTVIHSVELVTDGTRRPDSWVRFEGRIVHSVGSGDSWRQYSATAEQASPGGATPPADEVVDGRGAILTPGFIDLHMHGGGGYANEDGAAAIAEVVGVHRAHGTTRAVLSLVTNGPGNLISHLETIAELSRTLPGVLGSHLEGPFLSAQYKGAHDPALLRSPEAAEIDALLAAANGTLRQITLAPELPGGVAAIEAFTHAGVAVAVGHTSADYAQALAAFDAGASLLTHTFNGMPGLHHREPGPVGAAFRSPHVTLELINDGVHVHPELAELLFVRAPGRVALITDAMAATCSADGDYVLGSLAVTVRDGVARLADPGGAGGAIAGSTLALDGALRQTVHRCGVSLVDAVQALTAVPAAAIARGHELGSLKPGYAADAVLLSRELAVQRVWVDGVAA